MGFIPTILFYVFFILVWNSLQIKYLVLSHKENRGTDRYTLSCMKYISSESVLYGTGNSTQGSVMTWVGGKAKTEGVWVYVELIHFAVQQNLTQHCKATKLK